jgi:hypothetical protein
MGLDLMDVYLIGMHIIGVDLTKRAPLRLAPH